MAYNPSPKVREAERVGKKFGSDMVVIILIDSKTESIEYASWGKTPELCSEARQIGDELFEELGVEK